MARLRCAEVAAKVHYDMCQDDRNGYSWEPRWGGDHPDGRKHLEIDGRDYSYRLGSMDCSSSVITAWRQGVRYTPWEGCFDDTTYTGDMREVFLSSGLFYADRTPARRGDVYLNDAKHTAMCQDGGDDGVYGYDCLSQFSINEHGGVYGGQVGDQTGREAWIREFYEYPWNTTLHYNGKADLPDEEPTIDIVEPPEKVQIDTQIKQRPCSPINDMGMVYQVHCEKVGWLPPVHDGQEAGTTGYGLRMEAIKINPPEGWVLFVRLHLAGVGWVSYYDICHGNDIVMGTIGEGRRIEGIIIGVQERPKKARENGEKLYFDVHQEHYGWRDLTSEGNATGSNGLSLRLEAIQIMIIPS